MLDGSLEVGSRQRDIQMRDARPGEVAAAKKACGLGMVQGRGAVEEVCRQDQVGPGVCGLARRTAGLLGFGSHLLELLAQQAQRLRLA